MLRSAYKEPANVPGFAELKADAQTRVERAWKAGQVPEDDRVAGVAVGAAKKPRAKKAKVCAPEIGRAHV